MSTEQSYVGKGDFAPSLESTATPPPPTAQNQAQPLSPTDERRAYFHRLAERPQATDYLEVLLDRLAEFADTTDPTPLLAQLTETYLIHPYYEPTSERVSQVKQALNLIGFLSNLRSEFTCFAIEATEPDTPNAEEGNGHE